MIGTHLVLVKNVRVQYKFIINRNITILRGDSATGKTTLIEMVRAYQTDAKSSGVTVQCDVPCVALGALGWQAILPTIHNSIVFIDEGDAFVASEDFAAAIKNSDNYYVIATRRDLFELPYSITEIYGIKNTAGNRYQGTKRIYSEFYPLYENGETFPEKPDVVVVEDSNSGYDFFSAVCRESGIRCISAGGKSNIYKEISFMGDEHILIIADGAAFGPEISRILTLRRYKKSISVYLPECFEWLILQSDIVPRNQVYDIRKILASPAEFVDSSKYFSWERFFTAILTETTEGTQLQYNKKALNQAYLNIINKQKILKLMPVNIEN